MIEKITNEDGVWEVADGCIWMLIEPSQKWLDEHPIPELPPEPATDEITAEEAIALLLGGEDE